MKKFCESLREQVMKIINLKNEVKSSKNHMKMQKFVIFVKKKFKMNM